MNTQQKVLAGVGAVLVALAPFVPVVGLPLGLTLAKVLGGLGAFLGGVAVKTPGHVKP